MHTIKALTQQLQQYDSFKDSQCKCHDLGVFGLYVVSIH